MLRLFWGAFALACGVTQAFPAPPTPADDSGSAPMRFEWRREGPAEACGANCRIWISAVGYITADTPREFEAFAKDPNARGAVLVLDSDGGSVLGTLALGRAIRNLGMVTTIGKTATLPPTGDGARRATLSPNGNCESMCAFLLLAGAQPLRAAARRMSWCIRSGSARSASRRWSRTIPPRSSTSCSAISAVSRNTPSRWAAAATARNRPADSAVGAAVSALPG